MGTGKREVNSDETKEGRGEGSLGMRDKWGGGGCKRTDETAGGVTTAKGRYKVEGGREPSQITESGG